MFTCDFKERCLRDEEFAKQKYFGKSKGIIRLFKKLTWIKWYRGNCRYSCPRHRKYYRESYENFLNSEGFEEMMKRFDNVGLLDNN